MVTAAIAVAVGVRAAICTMPVPIRMRDVCDAIQVAYDNASLPQDSATHTLSKPLAAERVRLSAAAARSGNVGFPPELVREGAH